MKYCSLCLSLIHSFIFITGNRHQGLNLDPSDHLYVIFLLSAQLLVSDKETYITVVCTPKQNRDEMNPLAVESVEAGESFCGQRYT